MKLFWSELRIFGSRIGGLRAILLHLALLAAFGIWIPWRKGLDFLDPQVLAAYACLGLIFSGPAAAQSFALGADSQTQSWTQAKSRVLISILYGEIAVIALLSLGIGTIYWSNHGGFIPTPDWMSLARTFLIGVGAAAMTATIAAWLSVQYSKRITTMALRLAFFGLLIWYFYYGQKLADASWLWAAAGLVTAGFFMQLMRRRLR